MHLDQRRFFHGERSELIEIALGGAPVFDGNFTFQRSGQTVDNGAFDLSANAVARDSAGTPMSTADTIRSTFLTMPFLTVTAAGVTDDIAVEGVVARDASSPPCRHRLAPVAFLGAQLERAFETGDVRAYRPRQTEGILSTSQHLHQMNAHAEFIRIHGSGVRKFVQIAFEDEAHDRCFDRSPPGARHALIWRECIREFVALRQWVWRTANTGRVPTIPAPTVERTILRSEWTCTCDARR